MYVLMLALFWAFQRYWWKVFRQQPVVLTSFRWSSKSLSRNEIANYNQVCTHSGKDNNNDHYWHPADIPWFQKCEKPIFYNERNTELGQARRTFPELNQDVVTILENLLTKANSTLGISQPKWNLPILVSSHGDYSNRCNFLTTLPFLIA